MPPYSSPQLSSPSLVCVLLQYIMGALIIFPIIALGISAFFSSTRPDKA